MIKKLAFIALLIAVAFVFGVPDQAQAALDLTSFAVNTDDVETIMGAVLLGLAALWGYRKCTKTVNRT